MNNDKTHLLAGETPVETNVLMAKSIATFAYFCQLNYALTAINSFANPAVSAVNCTAVLASLAPRLRRRAVHETHQEVMIT